MWDSLNILKIKVIRYKNCENTNFIYLYFNRTRWARDKSKARSYCFPNLIKKLIRAETNTRDRSLPMTRPVGGCYFSVYSTGSDCNNLFISTKPLIML